MGKFLAITLFFAIALGLIVQEAATAASQGPTELSSAMAAQDCMDMMQQPSGESGDLPCDCGFLDCLAMMSGAVAFAMPDLPSAIAAISFLAPRQDGREAQPLSSLATAPLPEPPKHLI